ncbi:LytTR family DNA-binding domain-containing protein [Flammeovirgaceae bacterium SG7u.111]|nr:LytTR family DNA-binding domain-containing protein [Flammeovirgaceae bacterium SG7u.132]WPO34667.1 LytTR family DNA-binding domain-containing protein [Flammeovirgaceae bacterium SG7u.111]
MSRKFTVLLIEDENAAKRALKRALGKLNFEHQILEEFETVKGAAAWLKTNNTPDLIFMDIQLSDGISFEIFDKVTIQSPVIFTTAYDEYAIQAFRVNGLDYLLKPIDDEDLSEAIERFKTNFSTNSTRAEDLSSLHQVLQKLHKPAYRESFLVHHKHKMLMINVQDIAYFYVNNKVTYIKSNKNQDYALDIKMEEIEKQVDPAQFFRANRQYLVSKRSIQEIEFYFNSKLSLTLHPPTLELVTISKEKAPSFKFWANK